MKALVVFISLGVFLATPASAQRYLYAPGPFHATHHRMASPPEPQFYRSRQIGNEYPNNLWTG
jgi:hypothetical protein